MAFWFHRETQLRSPLRFGFSSTHRSGALHWALPRTRRRVRDSRPSEPPRLLSLGRKRVGALDELNSRPSTTAAHDSSVGTSSKQSVEFFVPVCHCSDVEFQGGTPRSLETHFNSHRGVRGEESHRSRKL